MKILTFESSCDETAVAVVENGRDVLGYSVASSLDLHAQTGGVVPEVAAREHVIKINAVMDEALSQAGLKLEEVDAIAATAGPGLLSSLLTGFLHAKTLATFLEKPFIPVHHILAHVYANFLERDEGEIEFPVVCLTVSGGHNELLLFKNHFEFEVLGRTRDDASGEAFDKVARMLGLGYPGGPAVSKAAERGVAGVVVLPRPWLNESTKKNAWDGKCFDFSFSGLKSAVRREVESRGELSEQDVADIAFSFQESVCSVLSTKLVGAGERYGAKQVWIAGGVSANRRLREVVAEKVSGLGGGAGVKGCGVGGAGDGVAGGKNNVVGSGVEVDGGSDVGVLEDGSRGVNGSGGDNVKVGAGDDVASGAVSVFVKEKMEGQSAVVGDCAGGGDDVVDVCERKEVKFLMPKQFRYCTDNGAMIGAVAYYQMREGILPEVGDASPSLSMEIFNKAKNG